MRNILTIARNDLRVFFADRGNWIGLVLIPVLLTTVLGLTSQGANEPRFDILALDLDGSEQSAQFIEELRDASPFFIVSQTSDLTRDDARERISNGSINAAVVIPEGFGAAVDGFTATTIEYYSSEDALQPSIITPALQTLITRWNGAITAARVGERVAADLGTSLEGQTLYNEAQLVLSSEPVLIAYTLTETETEIAGTGFGQSVPGMGSMFVMFTVLGGMAVLLRERRQWTLQRLVTMPLRRSEILGGKVIAYFVQGILQYAVVVIIGLLFGMNFGNDLLALALVAVAFVLAVTALALLLATVVTTEGQANQLTTLLSLILAAIGGAWWPLEIVPDFMKVIGHISPVAWAMDAFQGLLFFGEGLVNVLPEIGILLLYAAVFFGLGVMRFRYE